MKCDSNVDIPVEARLISECQRYIFLLEVNALKVVSIFGFSFRFRVVTFLVFFFLFFFVFFFGSRKSVVICIYPEKQRDAGFQRTKRKASWVS